MLYVMAVQFYWELNESEKNCVQKWAIILDDTSQCNIVVGFGNTLTIINVACILNN